MRAAFVRLSVALLLLGFAVGDAHAHGGNWRSPGGSVPPQPGDPTAPRRPRTPRAPTPVTRPPKRTPRGLRGSPKRTRKGHEDRRYLSTARWQPGNWEVWWDLNQDAFLAEWAPRGRGGAVVTPRAGSADPGEGAAAPDATATALDARAEAVVLPFLVSLLDPEKEIEPTLRAAALLAVGRSARDAGCVPWMLHHARDADGDSEVRESAVLALGLLRRSDPSRRLACSSLSAVRDACFAVLDDEGNEERVRAFAAFSLALLADQPCGDAAIDRNGRLVTRALWLRLKGGKIPEDVRIALLTALGHQPTAGVPSAILEKLVRMASGRTVAQGDELVRSHALTAVARLGAPDSFAALRRTLCRGGEHPAVHTAAVIGFAQRAPLLTPEERVEAVLLIRRHANLDRPAVVRGFGLLSLGALLGADLRAGSHEVLKRTDAAWFLRRQAEGGTTTVRPYAVLGLGLAVNDLAPTSRQVATLLAETRAAIVRGLKVRRGSDEAVGALAVAAGLSRAEGARTVLLAILGDQNRGPSLRGHAALALGQFGHPDEETLQALRSAVEERVSPFVHLQAVLALSLLRVPDAADLLVKRLRHPWTQRAPLAPVAAALGRLRDPEATRTLLDLARNPGEVLVLRVAAVVALGLTFDPERRPSRVILTTHANYPALTESLAQVFNIV